MSTIDYTKFLDGKALEAIRTWIETNYQPKSSYTTASATDNAFTVTIPGITALTDGMIINVKFNAATASGATLNVNNLGAKAIYYRTGTAVTTHIVANNYVTLVYDATNEHWVMLFSYDANTNTIGYQIRTNSSLWANKTGFTMNRYTLLFEVNGGLSGAATTIGTGTNKVTVNFKYIPGGVIKYYTTKGNIAADSDFGATGLWDQYTLDLRYTFNIGSTLTSGKPVYMRCSINTDGTLTPNYAGSPYHPITQDLPTTEDGYVYVLLGQAYSTIGMELYNNHPIYQYKGGKICLYSTADPTVSNATITIKQSGISDQTFTLNGSDTTITLVDTWRPLGTGSNDACAGNDSRLSDSRTPKSHTHGNIQNDGTITSTAVTSATGVLVYDSSNKIQRATAAQTRTIIGAGTYSKPSGGIPASDLAESYYLASNPNGYTSVTETTVSGWGFTKNAGTVTGVSINGTSVATSGVANITSIPWSIISDRPTVDTAISISSTNAVQNKAIPLYIASRGENLLTNGTALLGNNYNFTSFTYDGSDTYYAGGCFKHVGGRIEPKTDEYMPVDVSQTYEISYWARSSSATSTLYDYLAMYDIDKLEISAKHIMWISGSTTTLARELKNGDTKVYLTSVAGFTKATSASYQKGLIFWNYTNSFGYVYGTETYSRNVYTNLWAGEASFDTTNNCITLSSAWNKGTIPAGTSVSQSSDGSTYTYMTTGPAGSTNWFKRSATMSGVGKNNASGKFREGTAFVRLGWLIDQNSEANVTWKLSTLSVSKYIPTDVVRYVSQSLTDAQKAQARTNIGAGTSSFSGNYNDLTNKPTIPTKTSELTNDSGYITSSAISGKYDKTGGEISGAVTITAASGIPLQVKDGTGYASLVVGAENATNNLAFTSSAITKYGSTQGNGITLSFPSSTASHTLNLPAKDGTIATTGDFSVSTGTTKSVTANGNTLTFGSNAFNSTPIPTNIQNGSGTGAIQEIQDGTGGTFNFTGKNPNATALDSSLTGNIAYGGVGNYSASFGGKSQASGKRSVAQGTTTVAKGNYSHAEGDNSVSLGADSHAEGYQTVSYGGASHAEGTSTQSLGNNSHAEGNSTIARSVNSHAEGYNSQTLISDSTRPNIPAYSDQQGGGGSDPGEGGTPTAQTGDGAHVEGSNTRAVGNYSHAEGTNTWAGGLSSHAEGYGSQANYDYSHAEGYNSVASGYGAHATGLHTVASGNYSFTQGQQTEAGYNLSSAFGKGTKTHFEAETVVGKYNSQYYEIGGTPLFTVGNGTADNARSNAFVVYVDGHAELKLQGQTNNSIALKAYVDNIVSGKQNALPTTTTAGQVLKSTSTAGTVEWGSVTSGTQLYKHDIKSGNGDYHVIAIRKTNTPITSVSEFSTLFKDADTVFCYYQPTSTYYGNLPILMYTGGSGGGIVYVTYQGQVAYSIAPFTSIASDTVTKL